MPRPERPPTAVWERLRRLVFVRDGYRCRECGRPGRLECDHIVPIFKGGTHDPENLQTLCRDCHAIKSRSERRPPRDPAWAALVQEMRLTQG